MPRFSLSFFLLLILGCITTAILLSILSIQQADSEASKSARLQKLEKITSRIQELEEKVISSEKEVQHLKLKLSQKSSISPKATKIATIQATSSQNKFQKSSSVQKVQHDMCNLVPTSDVEIDMLDLIEDEPFLNPSVNLPWKQGFQLKNDPVKQITVHVVPHSHNDPGWIKTLDSYFSLQTKKILNTIIEGLLENPSRRFIWAEISYLSKYWTSTTENNRKNLKKLVENGQLELVTSGWVMPDEANTHWYSLISQLALGNDWTDKMITKKPRKSSWAIDPFGHSNAYAWILKSANFENALIQRVHYAVKRNLGKRKMLEFKWRQDFDTTASQEILTHMMPFYSYDVPHTCGPDPSICCQFDFARMKTVNKKWSCPWKKDPISISITNVRQRSESIVQLWREKADLYQTDHVLVPLGDDFRYQTKLEFDAQFQNYEKLFDYINSNPDLKTNVKWSTLTEYFDSIKSHSFPSLSGDFFTYADRDDHYWSGYFTTRPYHKNFERFLANQIFTASFTRFFYFLNTEGDDVNSDKETLFKLSQARAELGVFQHHDGITGTARNDVVTDYTLRMEKAFKLSTEVMEKYMAKILNIASVKYIAYQHEKDMSKVEYTKAFYVDLSPGSATLVVQNQIINTEDTQVIEVLVSVGKKVRVVQSGKICKAQLEKFDDKYNKLVFIPQIEIPSLGYQVFQISTDETGVDLAVEENISGVMEAGTFAVKVLPDLKLSLIVYKSDMHRKEKEGAYLFLPEAGSPKNYGGLPKIGVETGEIRKVISVKVEAVEYNVLVPKETGKIKVEVKSLLGDSQNNHNIGLQIEVGGFENEGFWTDMNGVNFSYKSGEKVDRYYSEEYLAYLNFSGHDKILFFHLSLSQKIPKFKNPSTRSILPNAFHGLYGVRRRFLWRCYCFVLKIKIISILRILILLK